MINTNDQKTMRMWEMNAADKWPMLWVSGGFLALTSSRRMVYTRGTTHCSSMFLVMQSNNNSSLNTTNSSISNIPDQTPLRIIREMNAKRTN